jgi:hypothetical protein
LINLVASSKAGEILESSEYSFAIAERVQRESIHVRRGGEGPESDVLDKIDLDLLLSAGLLHIKSLESDAEFASFVAFAQELDDGESETCALAVNRRLLVATDDRKVLRMLKEGYQQIPTTTTPTLIKHWIDAAGVPPEEASTAIRAIQQRARYVPPRSHVLHEWWTELARIRLA